MSESSSPAPDAQVANGAQPPAGTQDTAQDAVPPNTVDELPAWAQKELRDLRKENAARRATDKKQRDAEMSDLQRATSERDDLLQRFNDASGQLRELKARDLLRGAGALSPELLTSRLSEDAIAGDEKAQGKEIETLRKAYPHLFRVGGADGAAGRSAPPSALGGSLTDALATALKRKGGVS